MSSILDSIFVTIEMFLFETFEVNLASSQSLVASAERQVDLKQSSLSLNAFKNGSNVIYIMWNISHHV